MARPRKDSSEVLEVIQSRVEPETILAIKEVGVRFDRSDSYIIRKLVARGLAAYGRDGMLDEPEDSAISASSHPELIGKKLKAIGSGGPNSKN